MIIDIRTEPAEATYIDAYPNIKAICPNSMAPRPIPRSKKEKNVAFAIPRLLAGEFSTDHACRAGWTLPKPSPYNEAAMSSTAVLGSQARSSIAINIDRAPGRNTYRCPFLS